ncbi:hypothetical protein ACKAV7_011234 [Fusarium commune]
MNSRNTRQVASDAIHVAVDGFTSMISDYQRIKDQRSELYQREDLYLPTQNERPRSISPLPVHHHIPASQSPIYHRCISQQDLRLILDHIDLYLQDISFVERKRAQLIEREVARAEQMIGTALFQDWMLSTGFNKLLIHWNRCLPRIFADISPFSALSITLMRIFRSASRFISILWVCGCHIDTGGQGTRTGGRSMLSSFIDQLLRQFPFDMQCLHQQTDVVNLQSVPLPELVNLFRWLISAITPDLTIVFIIDGAFLYERDEFEQEALLVFRELFQLPYHTAATIKVLFMSSPGTSIIRRAFEVEDKILSVEGLPLLGSISSEDRVTRGLSA